jgi:dTDP-4-dehydrorhamnose 3,5-epimerase
MQVEETKLKDCVIVKDTLLKDPRGYFFESFNQQKFNELTRLNVQFVQDNQSKSSKGVLRGLHFQLGDHAQAKLVRVLDGEVLDVAVDIRPNSKTFGEHIAIELSAENETQLFVPRGFAHGFVVLSDTATFFYKCDNYYHKLSESGIIYNDPQLAIQWQLTSDDLLLSEKDLVLKNLNDISGTLIF